ncbi:MAG: hypothetical protein JXA25_18530 [Anaerolineales bacterium]|nr:hypothetical protein [Anaerolineales bacterium]
MGETLSVGLGEIVVSRNSDDVLVAYGLGSCLGIACYDDRARIAGMLHAVLPRANGNGKDPDSRYVEHGIPELFQKMVEAGGSHKHFSIRIAGGAHMLDAPGFTNVLNIGQRNIEAADSVLQASSVPVVGKDVGGNVGRTIRLYVDNGRMTIRRLGGEEIEF